jgi:hypothetical protein
MLVTSWDAARSATFVHVAEIVHPDVPGKAVAAECLCETARYEVLLQYLHREAAARKRTCTSYVELLRSTDHCR